MTRLTRLLVPAALLVFAAVYFMEAGRIRVLYDTGPVGPQDFPRVLVAALVVGVAIVLFGEWRRRPGVAAAIAVRDLGVVALLLLCAALYVALFARIGFAVSTFALSLALLPIFARGAIRPRTALVQAFVITAAVYVLFGFVFDVRLPPTPLLDRLAGAGGPA